MRKLYLIVLLVVISINSYTQSTFQKIIGGTSIDDGNSIIKTTDGNYVILGTTASFGVGLFDVYLIKMDINGDTIWTKTYGGTGNDVGNYVIEAPDGGYLIVGYTDSYGMGYHDVFVIKTDANGNPTWTKAVGGANNDEGFFVQNCSDNCFLITGYSGSFTGNKLYCIKINNFGDTLWTKVIGSYSIYKFPSSSETSDGNYFITCNGTPNSGGQGIFLIKINSLGDTLWTKVLKGNNDIFYSICQAQTLDGGIIIVGYNSKNNDDVLLIKSDINGNVLWSKTYQGVGDDVGTFVLQTSDNGYIIVGYTSSFGSGAYDVLLIKTDSLGNKVWSKTYGGTSNDYGFSAVQTNDGGFYIAARSSSFGWLDDIYYIKTDASGNSNCDQTDANLLEQPINTITAYPNIQVSSAGIITNVNIQVGSGGMINKICPIGIAENELSNNVQIYQNDNSKELYIEFSNFNINSKYELKLYNTLGIEISKWKLINSITIIDDSFLSKGIFLYQLTENSNIIETDKICLW